MSLLNSITNPNLQTVVPFDRHGRTKLWYTRIDKPGWFQNRPADGNTDDWHSLPIGLPTLTEIQTLLPLVTNGSAELTQGYSARLTFGDGCRSSQDEP
jgi:hypothetical protein